MEKRKIDRCSFCHKTPKQVGPLVSGGVPGDAAFICRHCLFESMQVLDQGEREAVGVKLREQIPDPVQLYEHLNRFIIGQERAKKVLAVSVHNHYLRLLDSFGKTVDRPDLEHVQIEKSNVLLIGPTGTGKTMLARSLAQHLRVPFAIGDATTLTEAGYVGEDVENLLQKLLQAANWDIEAAERGIIYIDEIDKTHKTTQNVSVTRDVSGEGVQQSLLKIVEGYVCNVPPQGGRKHPEQQFVQIDTTNILFICGGTFSGIEDIIAHRLGKRMIGFGRDEGGHMSETERNRLLTQVDQDDLERYGMIPELIGRFPVITPLDELTVEDLGRVLTTPDNALLKQYQKLFAISGLGLEFTPEAVDLIARRAKERKTGARALRSIIEKFMTDLRFNVPAGFVGHVVVDADVVAGTAAPVYVPSAEAA